jgi:hypothetical protein
MYRRYPMMPIIAWILRVLAIFTLAFFVFTLWDQLSEVMKSWALISKQPQFAKQFTSFIFEMVLKYFVPALVLWGLGDLLLAVRDIEFFTRTARGVTPVEAATVKPEPLSEKINQEIQGDKPTE